MPVDTSNSRRAGRSSDGDLGLRRARGEISCAECRRLKLKCDKKVPCGSCTRRGCAPICPNGSLSTGQGARSHLADTAQLHAKIAEMGYRINQLEDALATLQSTVSEQTHPLLQEELLSIKSPFGQNTQSPPRTSPTSQIRLDQTTATFGTLSIGDQGEGKYFGPSAGSEALFLAGANLEAVTEPEDEDTTDVSIQIARILSSEGNTEGAMDVLFDHLPEQPRAWALCETYLEQSAWTSKPIKRDEVIEDILSPTYKALKARDSAESPVATFSPHKLAVLYLIFSLGGLVDLTLEPCSKESEHYYHLSKACLSLRSVFDSPEIATVQALLLMSGYHGWAGTRYTVDSSWSLISLSAKIAQSLGLHRDPSRFNLDEKSVERRRSLFWELFSSETLYSLALGRPPSIRVSYIDCQFPSEEEGPTHSPDGKPSIGFYRWKYEYAKDIMASILEQTVTAAPPTYETILDLDRRVREKVLPAHLNMFMGPEEPATPSVYMHGCLLGQYRAMGLLYIHRNFFAQAILDHPENPLRSPYAPSFLATYRCASGVIKATMNHQERFPELCGRWWGVWTHLFSAAMIVGCIVTRAPACSMASSAYIELGLACDLFEKGAIQTRRGRSGLAILYKIRQRASEVYSQYISGDAPKVGGILSTGQPDYGSDELALFGGQTKVLVSKLLSHYRKKPRSSTSPTSTTASSPASTSEGDHRLSPSLTDVHPHLVEYLSMYPPSNHPSPSGPDASSSVNQHDTGPVQQVPHVVPEMKYDPQQQGFTQSVPPEQSYSWWNQGQPAPNGSGIHGVHDPTHFGLNPFPSKSDPIPNASFGFDQGFVQDDASQLVELGMILSGGTGTDEQWLSFMRDSGFLGDNNTANSNPPPRQSMFGVGDMVGII